LVPPSLRAIQLIVMVAVPLIERQGCPPAFHVLTRWKCVNMLLLRFSGAREMADG
jgi:hypothetical protein